MTRSFCFIGAVAREIIDSKRLVYPPIPSSPIRVLRLKILKWRRHWHVRKYAKRLSVARECPPSYVSVICLHNFVVTHLSLQETQVILIR